MKKFLSNAKFSTAVLSIVVGVLVVTASLSAATTISTNITTAGTLTVSGGLTTLGTASTTVLTTTGNFIINGLATTTASDGTFITQGKVAIATTSVSASSYALDVTGTTTLGAGVVVGKTGTAINQILSGTCGVDFPAFSGTASTTVASCTASGVNVGDRIFFTASSTAAEISPIIINAASSSAANTIQFQAYNASTTANGSSGSTYSPGVMTLQWMAIR